MATTKFYNLSNLPSVECSPTGDKVYEWSYLDKVGNLKTDKRNVYEEIQSYKNQVDYKRRIKEGEDFSDGNAIYMDTTKFSGDYADVNDYLKHLSNDIRSQIATNNATTNGATSSQVAEDTKEGGKTSGTSEGIGTDGKQDGGSN